jgi:hypothetical protein
MIADARFLGSTARTSRALRWPLTEPATVFLVMFALYFGAACYLALIGNVVYGDTMARAENAQRILLSRDPHLAAIGFVWNPLPVIALLPAIPLKFLSPELITRGLAGNFISAICMSAAILQVRGMFIELGLRRRFAILLAAPFAFHPLIFVFAANGMSEAMLVLLLLIATRYLARWLRDFDLNSLIATGIALSLAYFTRSEALAGALGVIATVALASFVRNRGLRGHLSTTICDVAIVASPVTLAFVFWALASWLITGHPFERFSSIYDNRTVASSGYVPWSGSILKFTFLQLTALEPALPVLVVLAGIAILSRRHSSLVLACFACLGATLAFMVLAELSGSIPDELRYLIVLVPIAVVLAGSWAAAIAGRLRGHRRWNRAAAFACTLSVVAALPVSAVAVFDNTVNPDSALYLQSVFDLNGSSVAGQLNWTTERRVAADLDTLNLSPGTVLLDDYLGTAIVVSSNNPKQFVITSDRDFQSILADPRGTGVRYILVPQPGPLANADAVNRQYPGFYESGGGFATLVREYTRVGVNDTTWRLYRIN